MAFCPGCGTQVADGTTFCPSCGKPMTAAAGSAAAAAPAPVPVAAAPSSGLADNIAGLLCYSPVGLICSIIWLVAEPYKSNKFLRFHSFQSLFLGAAMFVFWIAMFIVGLVLGAIAGPLALIMFPIDMIVLFGFFGLCIFMMIKAYGMQTPHLPIVGALADKQV
jgi:uncharacterized membrane protein